MNKTRRPSPGRPATRPGSTGPSRSRPGTGTRARTRPVPTGRTSPPDRRDPRRPGDRRIPGLARERHPQDWFALRLLLTLSGQKPVHWMLGHTVGAAYDQLMALAPGLPLRGPVRPRIVECRGSEPVPDVLEAHAVIAYGPARRALAFRLERGADDRWRCAAVEVGPRPAPD
ncbi:hypothetical protein SRB5_59220 [Streptomyces sp. RB5]|uniref:Uncharacterized protein n=1 Tax=Streptomyces smaragdinus TaxID=2585196 RepID=A0A7K0CRW7_9ACTN|nr:Rv3235 family protein [Streptomyces smaragdinus]MQY15732.1 hypothetical protein [Streptomyces smaragdinus]